jgi:hypothetical protein
MVEWLRQANNEYRNKLRKSKNDYAHKESLKLDQLKELDNEKFFRAIKLLAKIKVEYNLNALTRRIQYSIYAENCYEELYDRYYTNYNLKLYTAINIAAKYLSLVIICENYTTILYYNRKYIYLNLYFYI